jgi:preprotein translocase subunit SecA
LVEYDDVVNKHREVIYGERKKILSGADLKANILSLIREEIQSLVHTRLEDEHGVSWDLAGLVEDISAIFPQPVNLSLDTLSQMKRKQIAEKLIEYAENLYEERERELGAENMRMLERLVMLRIIDSLWVEHLTLMEHTRQGIGLRAVGHIDPLVVYKKEGHTLFQSLLANIRHDVVHTIYHVTIVKEGAPQPVQASAAGRSLPQKQSPAAVSSRGQREVAVVGKKVGRNDPCPCGSGKKYKRCCGG